MALITIIINRKINTKMAAEVAEYVIWFLVCAINMFLIK